MRATPTNISIATFTIAVNKPYNQEKQEQEADFINCIVWRKQAENLTKYCHKGSQIAIEGHIQTRNYTTQDGNKRYVTEIICESITFLGSSNKTENKTPGDEVLEQVVDSMINTQPQTDTQQGDPFKDFGEEIQLSDEDLPF